MRWVPLAGGGADLERQVAEQGGEPIRLTTKERDLVAYFASRPGATITRTDLLVHVWKQPASASEEPVYSAIKRLRAKIDRGSHQHVVSVHGDGYRWVAPHDARPDLEAAPARTARRGDDAFFGRTEEREAAERALGERARVVTLVGPGGAGKTRLAIEIAAGRDHVFCDLSGASDEATCLRAIAEGLGSSLAGSDVAAWSRAVRRAIAALGDRLVVLDNVENVTDVVARFLAGGEPAPLTAMMLATSREPIRVRGERVVPVASLPAEAALALFEDRARAAGGEPGPRGTAEAIVARLDRLPLAIELAAAQAPALGADALLASLDRQLDTLVAGARDAPARHATLRATVAWSWALLAAAEHEALVDLATFAGPFDVEAGREVVGQDDATATIAALTRKSLVVRDGGRLRLYAAARELARERRAASSEGAARHARHFARRGSEMVAALEGPSHREAAAWLDREMAELRAALDGGAATPGCAAELAMAVDAALGLRGADASLRADVLRRARATDVDAAIRARLLLAEASLPGTSIAPAEAALAAATTDAGRAEAGLALGQRLASHETSSARRVLEGALRDADRAEAHRTRGRILAILGEIAHQEGAVAEARDRLGAALAAHQRTGDHRAIARTSAHLAHLDRLERGEGSAAEHLRRAAASAETLGDPMVSARVALDRGQHLARLGDQEGARAALDEASRVYERLGFVRERALLHLHLTETLVGVGDLGAALAEAHRALDGLDASDVARSTVHEAIACVHLLAGALGEAAAWIASGLDLARESGAVRSECTLLGKRGLLHLARGDARRAWVDFDEAVRKNDARGSEAITGASLVDRAMASLAEGREEAAAADLARARDLLHDPPPRRPEGRMIVVCEAAGRAFHAVAIGADPAAAERELRARAAPFFDRVPAAERDLVVRFLEWLVGVVVPAARATRAER